ncbi:hypothetical protein [Micromonospora sp. b486]|uniref:hypothetical protein n=1 Tax=Micromonospora sp. b486 TaxID=3053986 RepID=UPI00259D2A4F|nr:hypothetical protein [Micromonospora sp. b486]MDM4784524.1 hypothetical protein [Micromonospora sp. b486]
MALGSFGVGLGLGLHNGIYLSIIQVKVPQRFHGRVLAIIQTLTWATLPLGFAVLVPLSGSLLEPMFAPGGALAGSVGALIGTARPGLGVRVRGSGWPWPWWRWAPTACAGCACSTPRRPTRRRTPPSGYRTCAGSTICSRSSEAYARPPRRSARRRPGRQQLGDGEPDPVAALVCAPRSSVHSSRV